MPPRVKITKEDIVSKTLELVRCLGEDAINARSVATALGSSTQPIFSNFSSMDELRCAVVSAALERYHRFIENEIKSEKYPMYKASGMAYIRFASEERELFKLLFMCDRTNADVSPDNEFETAVMTIMERYGMTEEAARLMHLEIWTSVHGIATMLATSFLTLDWELISNILSDVFLGVKARFAKEKSV